MTYACCSCRAKHTHTFARATLWEHFLECRPCKTKCWQPRPYCRLKEKVSERNTQRKLRCYNCACQGGLCMTPMGSNVLSYYPLSMASLHVFQTSRAVSCTGAHLAGRCRSARETMAGSWQMLSLPTAPATLPPAARQQCGGPPVHDRQCPAHSHQLLRSRGSCEWGEPVVKGSQLHFE